MEELVDASIDYLLHYGDSDHWFFIPQAKDEEDALRYFFCIEGYGQSRQFGTLQRELCLLVPLQHFCRIATPSSAESSVCDGTFAHAEKQKRGFETSAQRFSRNRGSSASPARG
ncbi:conserved hypothetical protein [Thiomonas arsenitoxydans]|uniref:Uncharacterized protein n=1 Tax=Thiomonas arsenitoxydans (strain DSM 22701 / CIP 110005 / 3As) TaxID=426114 RepID=D6CTA0_THIA3|nr:hypothetical protein [Thiomonas arsenitoxydans]CAZ88519.1 hypothetical protein THI_1852 [Thiomonas arsenitoxydans]CQR27500.1 conserved hypothetical protein [Thiomonas arsenitoxydans]CQR32472.1 conserved hypothetical protein [Thiomonas arsenitoxydans]CQR34345.1 conserved hypothetical protein [Thiomonas arsenitoxydans]CQR34423.1 conserved hypothetical protein [Thiomonas arsenitoxydans]